MEMDTVYTVDPDTCDIRSINPSETIIPQRRHHRTRQEAALFAFHLACEKMNAWSLVKDNAWQIYVVEKGKVKP